jgi:tRNA threonylcarbamoyladenosine biosynthesis protein TsaB
MKILALETSCEHASIALRIGESSTQRELVGHTNHSERLLPEIAALLADAGLRVGDLDIVAFGAGPGAFTGLRLSCGVAQGLALGADIGVVRVSSLAALASACAADRVFALADARMGEIYAAGFSCDAGAVVEVLPHVCIPPDVFDLPDDGAKWWLAGSALRAYPGILARMQQGRVVGSDAEAVPRAADVARLGAGIAAAGGALAPELAVPIYVRDKVALTTAERLARGGRA